MGIEMNSNLAVGCGVWVVLTLLVILREEVAIYIFWALLTVAFLVGAVLYTRPAETKTKNEPIPPPNKKKRKKAL